jgi:protein-histidine pros-kinase
MYGPDHGFGWKDGETVAARIVSVPMALPLAMADEGFLDLMLWLAVISLGTLVLLNLALVFTVIRPVARMSAAAEAISKGDLDVPELPVRGSDEIARLAAAFNRMHRSLSKAMALLG